jgi:2-oxoglutarate ferredoxin oxidoreductase subunit beta
VRFGPDGSMGLVAGAYGALEAVEAASVPESELVVHDATRQDPAYAFALSRLDSLDFSHTPIGVFRSVEKPSYDELMADQIKTAQSAGQGDLAKLIAGNDTWQVK